MFARPKPYASPGPGSDERMLLQELKKGNSKAFLELYNRYYSPLYYYVLRFVKVPALAEDVLQDAFLKIWELHRSINPELSFQGYLYRISRNCVFKLVKKIAIDENLRFRVMRQLQKNSMDGDYQLLWQEYEEIFARIITQLPPQRQKVFRLCREEGKTYEQAAAALGISRNTVKEHMIMAMKFVREQLQNYDISLSFLLLVFLR